MVGRFDPSPWNLGMPLLLAVACGPPLIGDEDGIDSTSGGPGTTDESISATSPTTTVSTTSPPQCYTADQCPPKNDCIDGVCVYQGYCAEDQYCCYGEECCGPECGQYYSCYATADCGQGYACNYGNCQPVPQESGCNAPSLGLEIPIPIDGQILSLAFLDDGIGGDDLLIGRYGDVQRVAVESLSPTPLGDNAVTAFGLAVRDLDADGDLDVAVSTDVNGIAEVVVLRDDGAWSSTTISGLPAYGGVAIADVEADGFPDVFSYGYGGAVYVAFNWGDSWSSPFYLAEASPSLGVGDIDGDGFEDAVVHNYYTTTITGGAALSIGQLYTGRNFGTTKVVAVGNFDGAALDDVLALEAAPGLTTLVSGWQGPVLGTSAYDSWWPGPAELTATADMNQDGYEDVVLGSVSGLLGVAFGGSEPPPDVIGCIGFIDTPSIAAMAVGDFTGDGRLDVAITDNAEVRVLAQGP